MIRILILLASRIAATSATGLFRRYNNDDPLILQTKHTTEGFAADVNVKGKHGAYNFDFNWRLSIKSTCESSKFFVYNGGPFESSSGVLGTASFIDDTRSYKFGGYYRREFVDENPSPYDGTLCFKAPFYLNELLFSLLRPYPKKSISFWFDTSVTPSILQQHQQIQTGEIIFGGINQQRFVENSGHIFKLKNLFEMNDNPRGWITNDLVAIFIQGKEGGARRNVLFDIGEPATFLPKIMYDALVFPMKSVLVDPLSRKYSLNTDNSKQINEFAGQRSNPDYFPCEEGQKLRSFKLNNLLIPKEILFKIVSGNNCVLTIKPHTSPDQTDLSIGFDVLKHFHLQVIFDKDTASSITISNRI